MKELENYIQRYFDIGTADLSIVANLFENTELEKDDYLLKKDQYTNTIHFVKSGYLRVYGYSKNGDKEVTQWISNEGMFMTDLSSSFFDTPSRWNIQELSKCEFYTISKKDFDSIGDYVDNWTELVKLFVAKCFVTLENRVYNQLSMSAEEKVKDLLETNPEIFNQVPLQYIASMLGMTPETLSRVRNKMSS